MAKNLVGYSRAGDEFHYRWAARRCLRIVYPNSTLSSIVIEGSNENLVAGEYVIDMSEYHEENGEEKVEYFQLKHTTVRKDKPFLLSDLKDTFAGFAARFIEHKSKVASKKISFSIITNRKFASNFRENLTKIIANQMPNARFKSTLAKYTGLRPDQTAEFCSLLKIEDGEGDYQVQKQELRVELAQIIAGSYDNTQLNAITTLIKDKVLPDSDGKIVKEEVLNCFHITSNKQLYPAEPIWEVLNKTIRREQHNILSQRISSSTNSVIIHAPGGVGKSVFTRQFIESLPEGSVGIAYDCFGAGKYRNRSETRHQHRDALVQIANELATKGLCEPLLVPSVNSSEREIMGMFLLRLTSAVNSIKEAYSNATLNILVDAADNAEMAAGEFNQACFANELLREQIPVGCKLVYLCRPERIHLLQPESYIEQLELEPFSVTETLENLKNHFPAANQQNGAEFHRLTSGNPRVQANALDINATSIEDLLASLSPAGTTVEDQIRSQLEFAVARVKNILPAKFKIQIDSICTGLATLSPNIPIDILAKASNVPLNTVKSFIADIGRSLWLSDISVHFRDEPTETWFRTTFCADKENFESYISVLEPLALTSTYVSELLPQLYLQAEQYQKLINIALSDDFLPQDNPIDARNVRVYRLQFAFKASLKSKKFSDAIKLAMRAGEEVAGDQRQLTLLQQNIDLLALLQSKEKIQSIAFQRRLSGAWKGSENIYSASLLSANSDFHGEARSFLRAAYSWLSIYFDESKKDEEIHRQERLVDRDLVELTKAALNLDGVQACLKLLFSLRPKEAVFRIVRDLTASLVDIGSFGIIDELLFGCRREPYFVIAITSELYSVGRFPEQQSIKGCLTLLYHSKTRIKRPEYVHDQNMTGDILSFLEACIFRQLPIEKILRVLKYYVPQQASRMVVDSHFSTERDNFLRGLAIKSKVIGDIDIQGILPTELKKNQDKYEQKQKIEELTQIIQGLLPWYSARIDVLSTQGELPNDKLISISDRSKKALSGRHKMYDPLPKDLAQVQLSILVLASKANEKELNGFFNSYVKKSKPLKIQHWLSAVRSSFRLSHLRSIRSEIQNHTYELINSHTEDGPDEIAARYILLARSILIELPDDASAYFDDAINIVSKFGDEISQRWDAVVDLGKRASDDLTIQSDELSYRFIRVAEVVGEQLREKHWDRAEALQIASRISTGAGLSALSRWRDRDVGRFKWILYPVIVDLIRTNKISALKGWSFAPYCETEQFKYFLKACVEEPCICFDDKQIIFNDAFARLRLENDDLKYWHEMHRLAISNGITSPKLMSLVESLKEESTKPQSDKTRDLAENNLDVPWVEIFGDHDVLTAEGLFEADKNFKQHCQATNKHYPRSTFWQGILNKVDEKDFMRYIENLLMTEVADNYDLQEIFKTFPPEWLNKPSFKKNYQAIVTGLGAKFALAMTSKYRYDYFIDALPSHKDTTVYFSEGIINGLANGKEFADAEIFFGFVRIAVNLISQQEAIELMDFSLSRFELHIDKDFGDGVWESWLVTSTDVNKILAALIWSALGSPTSDDRWRAVHTILKFGKFGNSDVIESLLSCLEENQIGAFGSKTYPFYDLHAKQYLLIALARFSSSYPDQLRSNNEVFSKYALGGKHIIIQRAAADTALNIEKAFPGTFEESIVNDLVKVGKSTGEIEVAYDYKTESPWHKNGQVDQGIDFHFGWDFDRYWFEPLGGIFGISGKQVQDLAANVVVNEWKIITSGYNNDPRVGLWNKSSDEYSTSHDHGSYPRSDNLDFYYSYHSMMVVASMLIEKMPTTNRTDWAEDRWEEWLTGHYITIPNDCWLSEYRDRLPLVRPKWIYEENADLLKSNPDADELMNNLIFEENGSTWLNVRGWWHERQNSNVQSCFISSALVFSPETATSLLNALQTCKNPHDFKLPSYLEDRMEIDSDSFKLKGWIKENDVTKGLDRFDPFAKGTVFPPVSIGDELIDQLLLSPSKNYKEYFAPISSSASIISEMWTSQHRSRDEEPGQEGSRLRCSLDFIKYLCRNLNCQIIIEAEIERRRENRHSSYDSTEVRPSKHKLFLISADGKIKSTTGNSELR